MENDLERENGLKDAINEVFDMFVHHTKKLMDYIDYSRYKIYEILERKKKIG